MKKNYNLTLIVFIIISFFLPLGLVPLFNLDEGAFSEATREMLVNHDFITTYLNGNLRFDKPILIYWLQAFSVSIFGLNEFALRLPSAVAGSLWVFGVFWFTKKYFDEKIAFLSAFFMISALQIEIITKAAIADSLLNMAIAFSMFFVWLYIDKKEKKYLYLTFAFIGIGTLTKGPVAIMIPLVVTFLYFLIKKDLKSFFKMVFDIKGIFIFLIIAMPWYILEYQAQGMKFIDGFILKHNLQRFDTSLEHHKGSIFYFIPVIILGLLPFTTLFFKLFTKIKDILKNDMFLFFAIWFGFVFIFFSFSGTKLPHYVIYGYTPLFILMAYYFEKIDFYVILPPLILLIILFFFPEIASNINSKKEFIQALLKEVPYYFNTYYKIEIGMAIVIFILLIFIKNNIFKIVTMGFVFSLVINFVVMPTYALIAKQNHYKVIMYGINTPSFSVYSESITPKAKPKKGDIVLTKINKLKKIKAYKILYSKNGIYLIKVEK